MFVRQNRINSYGVIFDHNLVKLVSRCVKIAALLRTKGLGIKREVDDREAEEIRSNNEEITIA